MDLERNPGVGAWKFGGILRPDRRAGRSCRSGVGFLGPSGRRLGRRWGGNSALDGVEPHGDGMGAKGAPLSRGSAGAEIINIDGILDHQTGAIAGVVGLDHPAQGGGSPIGGQNLARSHEGASQSDGLPTPDLDEECFSQFDRRTRHGGTIEEGRAIGWSFVCGSRSGVGMMSIVFMDAHWTGGGGRLKVGADARWHGAGGSGVGWQAFD